MSGWWGLAMFGHAVCFGELVKRSDAFLWAVTLRMMDSPEVTHNDVIEAGFQLSAWSAFMVRRIA